MSATQKKQVVDDVVLQKELKKEAKSFIQQLKGEKLVPVYGNKVFQKSLGDYYTFLLNGYSVTIYFNGTYQNFPESVAKLLQKKLDAIAVSVSPVNEDVKL